MLDRTAYVSTTDVLVAQLRRKIAGVLDDVTDRPLPDGGVTACGDREKRLNALLFEFLDERRIASELAIEDMRRDEAAERAAQAAD